jgi:predicted phage terminase large subunit-like protein|nr:MAG TPA: Terminase [Caudoviricetes sp.]
MNYNKLKTSINRAITAHPRDFEPYNDLFALCREYEGQNFGKAHDWNHTLRMKVTAALQTAARTGDFKAAEKFNDLLFRSLLFGAPHFFDDYLQAVEWGKPLDKKFYQPRRHYLKRYVDAYQEVLEGKLDFLSISMPKRGGKSQLGINFTNMLSGKYPDRATLMEGTGDDLVKSFYLGCLEYLVTPSEYHFYDIFPESKLVQTNADTKIINLLHKSRFPTVMCRSIDARQVGLSEATNLLYLDDCVEGREEAKNRQRLDDKWEVISGDIIGRAIEGTPIVICGTRYSLYDPIGHLQEEMRKQGKRMKIIETPALDPVTDESNFEYVREGKKVFTTQYFRDQREMLSAEQWESEFQQQPFEAKGLLFPEKSLNRFFELPVDRDPDSVIAVCDTADKGEDYCSMPVAAVYGEEVYIVDVVFDDSPPEVTKPECAKALMDNLVVASTFESNNAGSYFARDVQKILTDKKYVCNIRTKRTISNKQTRIEFASDTIIKNFYFKDPSLYARNSQYAAFMKQLTTYTRSGKVPHDDAPDSLSLLENELRGLVGAKVEIFQRPC